jgi:putative SOS response-associated peptidase YedK
LTGGDDLEGITTLPKPYPAEEMNSYRISNEINLAAKEGPELIQPIDHDSISAQE